MVAGDRGCWAAWARATRRGAFALAMSGGIRAVFEGRQYRRCVGIAMVLLMIWRPRGAIGHRAPPVTGTEPGRSSPTSCKEGHVSGDHLLSVDHLSMGRRHRCRQPTSPSEPNGARSPH